MLRERLNNKFACNVESQSYLVEMVTGIQTVKSLAIESQLKRGEEKGRLSRITALIDRTVQQLEVHTVGAILTPAQLLMLIMPAGGSIEYEV